MSGYMVKVPVPATLAAGGSAAGTSLAQGASGGAVSNPYANAVSAWKTLSTTRSTNKAAYLNTYATSLTSWTDSDYTTTSATVDINPETLINLLAHAKAGIIRLGQAISFKLPDGAIFDIKADGSYEILDKDAKVTYRACNIRDFNPFLNASDKLEDFIRYCGSLGVKQQEMLKLPMELFIAWLVLEAAKLDNEPEPDDIKLIPSLRKVTKPRCIQCQRFLPLTHVRRQIHFCRTLCFERYSGAGGLQTA